MDIDLNDEITRVQKNISKSFQVGQITPPDLGEALWNYDVEDATLEMRNMLSENQSTLKEQVAALKSIAESSKAQSESAANIAEASKIQAESAVDIANSSKVQADLAVEEADKANDTSLSAKLRANKALIVSIIAILVTLIVSADRIVHNVLGILSRLGII